MQELNHLRKYEFPTEMRQYDDSEDRSTLVKALCVYRKRYFERYPEICKETEDAVKNLEEVSTATTRTIRSQQIKSMIFGLGISRSNYENE